MEAEDDDPLYDQLVRLQVTMDEYLSLAPVINALTKSTTASKTKVCDAVHDPHLAVGALYRSDLHFGKPQSQ